ncbi:Putative DNA replication protein [Paucilactobacillus oligofermentans DSM 15707 = LMG 22743]|uniref:hypothetical protein n=1 Tax=Paucilactobacillus oligofermentans TaxID=293371 RepID=UPI00078E7FEE|nr:hypothetical protein [Paucilactobacillus oligofermentans]CUS26829.1 Putative DNA replication protein [Paucilactobacillus oligofermentans DSM 15707 = LMG 22743]
MANRRMLCKDIVESDLFYELTLLQQALYMHLSVLADDDGFVGNAKTTTKIIGGEESDLLRLVELSFLIKFDRIYLISDWLINNQLKNDRYKESSYENLRNQIVVDVNGKYSQLKDINMNEYEILPDTNPRRISYVSKLVPQDSKDQFNEVEGSLVEGRIGDGSKDLGRLVKGSRETLKNGESVNTDINSKNKNRLPITTWRRLSELSKNDEAELKLLMHVWTDRVGETEADKIISLAIDNAHQNHKLTIPVVKNI